ncbi:hypothetical protein [Zymomonas sp.]|uniref:hypothetical protein n=1 Tax=Zymomonas sp. TaxID=2068624 RepID=UPI0025D60FD3|nr:hypothetical protein [Zymomonas sp.]MCA1956479.1 hypothetical protein [Zymomonas sp.]
MVIFIVVATIVIGSLFYYLESSPQQQKQKIKAHIRRLMRPSYMIAGWLCLFAAMITAIGLVQSLSWGQIGKISLLMVIGIYFLHMAYRRPR